MMADCFWRNICQYTQRVNRVIPLMEGLSNGLDLNGGSDDFNPLLRPSEVIN
jgi:hypothetical protein